MAQASSNPKIEELRVRLKKDPKSRLFYQLAEELRRAGGAAEAEQVLRSGLSVYPTYLSAWVGLGRVLRELKNEPGAIEALNTAMQLDPGNVVAARLLADAHLAVGDKVEAIKKYKLVHALMPGDEELKDRIEQLDRDLHPVAATEPQPDDATEVPFPSQEAAMPAGFPADAPAEHPEVFSLESAPDDEESVFDKTIPPFDQTPPSFDDGTGDDEPMGAGHDESPFEEPADTARLATFELEHPEGMHIEEAPPLAGATAPVGDEEEWGASEAPFDDETPSAPLVFDDAPPEAPVAEEVTETTTMADLYARQGLHNEARNIYEHILAREPGNAEVRAKLDSINPQVNPKIDTLARWLSKVGRKEVGGV